MARINLTYMGQVDDPSGYGNVARNYVEELARRKNIIDLKVIPINFMPRLKWSEEHRDLLFKDGDKKDIVIHHMTPDNWKSAPGRINIGYAAWETNMIPRYWLPHCMMMDEIWTPSEYSRQAFINSGIPPKKVIVIPHGVDVDKFSPNDIAKLQMLNKENFNFLSVFQWNWRKGYDVLLKAYFREFEDDRDVSLILKTYGFNESAAENNRIRKEIMHIKDMTIGNKKGPKVIFIRGFLPMPEYLYRASDCFVLPARSEAWGVTYLEAMGCGVPVISTRYGGQLEFLNDDNSMLVEIDGEVPCMNMHGYKWYEPTMVWAEPSVTDLMEKMRYMRENVWQREKIVKKGLETVERWSWSNAVNKIITRLKKIT
ncbi:MAG: glycosyltransferase [Promethearchaeota archaeon]|nr:MAG: SIRV1 glycosyltransferase [Helarchaeota virus Nidhogg Meg22_1012]URC17400.1 MAG: glycosyltransferase [Helarchaeota virus Nidhogg Meg22_1214]